MKTTLIILLIILSTYSLFSQGEANNWYLNDSLGITFNTKDGEPIPRLDFKKSIQIYRYEGITVSEKSGRLLFYSDGNSFINSNHDIIFTHTDFINRNLRLIVFPKPGKENVNIIAGMFPPSFRDTTSYIFFFEMAINENTGLVEMERKDFIRLGFISLNIEAVRHENGRDIWLLFLENNKDEGKRFYHSILMNEDGIDFDTDKIFLSDSLYFDYFNNYPFIISPDGRKIVGRHNSDSSYLHHGSMRIFNFDRLNGIMTNGINIPYPHIDDSSHNGHYGYGDYGGYYSYMQFSPCSNKLYLVSGDYGDNGTHNHNRSLFQYSLEIHDSAAIKDSETIIIKLDSTHISAPQIGPNGKMYIKTGFNNQYLSVINNPDETGLDCDLKINDFYLGKNIIGWSLPDFFHEYLYKPFKGKLDVCIGDTIKIGACAANLYEEPDILWTGPNGFESKNKVVVIPDATLDMTGWYVLNVKAEGVAEYTDSVFVTVHPLPEPEIITFDPLNICYGDRVTLKLDKEYDSILWTTGETANRIHVYETGIVGVTVRDQFFCEAYTEVEIVISDTLHPEIIGGNKICKGDSVVLATNKFYNSYLWSTGDTTKSITVFEPGLYKVIVTRKGCEGTSEEFEVRCPSIA